MGYYTQYELQIWKGDADIEQVKKYLDVIMGNKENDSIFVIEDDCIQTPDPVKFYDHDEDCAEMSQAFPGVVFKLHGEGEEPGDLWNAYYKDGLCQICRAALVYPEYDDARLKTIHEAQKEDEGRP